MTTTSSTQRARSAVVAKKTATNDVSAIAGTSTGSQGVQTHLERAREIGQTIREAMSKLSDVDWARDTPATKEAESQLNEVITQFVEGSVSKMEVKTAYKAYVSTHRGGLF